MNNPDAISDSMKQLGRREASEPILHHEGVLCPPCLNREHDCWKGDCACPECNSGKKADPLGGQYLIGAVQRVIAWPSPLLHKTKLDCSWEELT